MSNKGWVCIYRSIQNNDLWNDKPFAKGQAWIDLILLSNYENTREYKRGNVYISEYILADRWGWSRKKVHSFLNGLQTTKKAIVKGTKQGTKITILNYDKYQNEGTTKDTTEGTTKDTTKDTTKNRIKSGKSRNEGTTKDTTEGTTEGTTKGTLLTNKQYNNINNINSKDRVKNTPFNNFQQREYDQEFYKELERKLFNRQSGDT